MFTKIEEAIRKIFAAIDKFLASLNIKADWDKIWGEVL